MAKSSMEPDVVAWMREQLQQAHPDLLREMLATDLTPEKRCGRRASVGAIGMPHWSDPRVPEQGLKP